MSSIFMSKATLSSVCLSRVCYGTFQTPARMFDTNNFVLWIGLELHIIIQGFGSCEGKPGGGVGTGKNLKHRSSSLIRFMCMSLVF